MTPPRCPFPVVEVEWIDAVDLHVECAVADIDTTAQLVTRHTTGYLVLRDDTRVVLAHDWDPPSTVGNLSVLPTGWVRSVREVRAKRRKRP